CDNSLVMCAQLRGAESKSFHPKLSVDDSCRQTTDRRWRPQRRDARFTTPRPTGVAMRSLPLSLLGAALLALPAAAQRPTLQGSNKQFVSIDAPVVALTHVKLVDGTGTPAKSDQTIVITGDKITAVGASGSVSVPAGAQTVDLTGRTVIPGLIGLHDHMYYSSPVSGSMKLMPFSYPKLFLANGLTTIRTTGSVDPYQEMNIKAAITAGQMVGPEIVVTGPYLQ